MQIICHDMFGNSAAIAVLFSLDQKDNELLSILGFGVDNPVLALKVRNMETADITGTFDIAKAINSTQHYISYTGSLTSPPCKEGIKWFILLTKLPVSQNQLDYFPILFGRDSNIRGIQHLNGRTLSII
jgi:carbonic anhydrase